MVRTHSRLGNDNGNHKLEPRVVEHAPEAIPAPEQITIARVQAMIRAMIDKQKEEMRQLI